MLVLIRMGLGVMAVPRLDGTVLKITMMAIAPPKWRGHCAHTLDAIPFHVALSPVSQPRHTCFVLIGLPRFVHMSEFGLRSLTLIAHVRYDDLGSDICLWAIKRHL